MPAQLALPLLGCKKGRSKCVRFSGLRGLASPKTGQSWSLRSWGVRKRKEQANFEKKCVFDCGRSQEEGSRQILEPRDEGDEGDMEMTKGIEGDKG